MFKIWAKILDDDRKLVKDVVYINEGRFSMKEFDSYLIEICHDLDIATPNTLPFHKNNYHKFNYTKFLARDFIEPVTFYCLILENGV
ncbi:MAG: hypothetical protein RR327_06030 [Clostridia bacterium]